MGRKSRTGEKRVEILSLFHSASLSLNLESFPLSLSGTFWCVIKDDSSDEGHFFFNPVRVESPIFSGTWEDLQGLHPWLIDSGREFQCKWHSGWSFFSLFTFLSSLFFSFTWMHGPGFTLNKRTILVELKWKGKKWADQSLYVSYPSSSIWGLIPGEKEEEAVEGWIVGWKTFIQREKEDEIS